MKFRVAATFLLVFTLALGVAAPALAASGSGEDVTTRASGSGDDGVDRVDLSQAECTGNESDCLPNPLGDGNIDLRVIIGRFINGLLGIVGSVALVVFMLGGLTWMTSGGNEDKIQKGKNMIIWASLGLAVIFLAFTVISFVLNALGQGVATGS